MLQTGRSTSVCQRGKGGHDTALSELLLAFSHHFFGPYLAQRGKKQVLLALRAGFKQTVVETLYAGHSQLLPNTAWGKKEIRSKRMGLGEIGEGQV